MRNWRDPLPGQVWADSDPRRLRKVQVTDVCGCEVFVRVLYPIWTRGKEYQVVRLARFMETGTKGMVRVS